MASCYFPIGDWLATRVERRAGSLRELKPIMAVSCWSG